MIKDDAGGRIRSRVFRAESVPDSEAAAAILTDIDDWLRSNIEDDHKHLTRLVVLEKYKLKTYGQFLLAMLIAGDHLLYLDEKSHLKMRVMVLFLETIYLKQ